MKVRLPRKLKYGLACIKLIRACPQVNNYGRREVNRTGNTKLDCDVFITAELLTHLCYPEFWFRGRTVIAKTASHHLRAVPREELDR